MTSIETARELRQMEEDERRDDVYRPMELDGVDLRNLDPTDKTGATTMSDTTTPTEDLAELRAEVEEPHTPLSSPWLNWSRLRIGWCTPRRGCASANTVPASTRRGPTCASWPSRSSPAASRPWRPTFAR